MGHDIEIVHISEDGFSQNFVESSAKCRVTDARLAICVNGFGGNSCLRYEESRRQDRQCASHAVTSNKKRELLAAAQFGRGRLNSVADLRQGMRKTAMNRSGHILKL